MRQLLLSLLSLAFLSGLVSAQTITETFGSGANAFTIDFVTIGNPGNAADTTGTPNPVGRVDYTYNLGKYEVSRDMVEKANILGSLGITLADISSYGGNGVNKPATGTSWLEAAKYVNYLNTNSGGVAAYKFDGAGNFQLWSSGDAGYSSSNQFRNSLAKYFLPSSNEWFKAAYGNPSGTWSNYPSGSGDVAPRAVSSGTFYGTAVYNGQIGPADITNSGGLSGFGAMALGGNAWEWTESAYDGSNDTNGEVRVLRGGSWVNDSSNLDAGNLFGLYPGDEVSFSPFIGFRVAMIPEPSSLLLLALGGAVVALGRRKRA